MAASIPQKRRVLMLDSGIAGLLFTRSQDMVTLSPSVGAL